jgi:hypothetical protein
MSRGLSRKQLKLLGLAIAVSRLRNGVPLARSPVSHPDYRIPVVTGVWADISTPLAAHVLGKVGLRPRWEIGGLQRVWLETTPHALSVRSAMSRALSSLMNRRMLAYKPYRAAQPHLDHGYVLTASGLAAGLTHELVVPELDRRLWLLKYKGTKERRVEWVLRELLPSPAVEEAR